MISTQVSCVIDAPIELVWQTIRPFDSLSQWHPYVAACSVEAGLSCSEVGCVRRIELQEGGVVRETLLGLSDREHCIVYDIIESPMPVKNYIATLRLRPLTETRQVYADWQVEFEITDGTADAMIATLKDIFATGLQALNRRLSVAA